MIRALGALLLLAPALLLAAEDHSGHEHHHGQLRLKTGEPVPSVEIRVEPDAMAGWNLQLRVDRFRFAPEHVNQAHVQGQGHAHVYVDGVKHARLYGPWLHLPALGAGTHRIRVTLNANSHEELAAPDGTPIAAVVEIAEP